MKTGNLKRTFFGYSGIDSLHSINNKLISGHQEGTLRVWDDNCINTIKEFPNHHSKKIISIKSYFYYIFTLGRDSTIKVIDSRKWGLVYNLRNPNFFVGSDYSDFHLSPNAQFVACGSKNGNIFVWDINCISDIEKNTEIPIEKRKNISPITMSDKNSSEPIFSVIWKNRNGKSIISSCNKKSSFLWWDFKEGFLY